MGIYIAEAAEKSFDAMFDPDTMVHEHRCPIRTSFGQAARNRATGVTMKSLSICPSRQPRKAYKRRQTKFAAQSKSKLPHAGKAFDPGARIDHRTHICEGQKGVRHQPGAGLCDEIHGALGDRQKAQDMLQAYYDRSVKNVATGHSKKGHLDYIAALAASQGVSLHD